MASFVAHLAFNLSGQVLHSLSWNNLSPESGRHTHGRSSMPVGGSGARRLRQTRPDLAPETIFFRIPPWPATAGSTADRPENHTAGSSGTPAQWAP
ncbi:hypothetical protein ABIA33_006982 [Streptacidiphilus sp. MAP12-16]